METANSLVYLAKTTASAFNVMNILELRSSIGRWEQTSDMQGSRFLA